MSDSLARSHDARPDRVRISTPDTGRDVTWPVLLSEAAVGFAELAPDADVYRFIAETLLRFAPDSIVLVSSCDRKSNTICVRALAGPDR